MYIQISLKSDKLFVDGRTDGCTDVLTYLLTDGHFPLSPPMLLSRLGGVELKRKNIVGNYYYEVMTVNNNAPRWTISGEKFRKFSEKAFLRLFFNPRRSISVA